MEILICAHDRPNSVNGPNIWLQRLLPELREEGIDARLLFFPFGNPEKCPTVQFLKNKGFPCEIYSGLQFTENKMRWILNKVRSYPPDIFIPHLNIPAYHASKIIKEAGIPTIGILHSNDPFYHGIAEEFIINSKEPFLSAVVCVSKFLKKYCENLSLGKLHIKRIPCGVPIPDSKAQYNGEKLKLIYAGRFVEEQKRILELTYSLCRLTEEVPGTESVLYGSGPLEPEMKELLSEYDKARVRLGGLVNSKDLQERFLENQVFVLLSDYEGLPIALMESMASGLVPVCYKMDSGIPELVTHGENGLIVEDRDKSFFEAVKRLKNDKGYWERMSNKARKKIEMGYSIHYMKTEWKHLLEKLAQEKHKKRNKIEIPNKFSLPPRNPSISKFEDRRWPGYPSYIGQRVKSLAERVFSGKN